MLVRTSSGPGSSSAGSSLIRRVGWNGLAQILPLLVQLALTPYLIRVLGLDGYGLWSLILVMIGTLSALDGGIGASLARFFAIHSARDVPAEAGRLVAGAVVIFVLLGLVVTGLAWIFAPTAVGWLDLTPALHDQAVAALHWLGLLVLLALLHGVVVSLLQANHRFRTLTITTATGQSAYVVAAITLLHPDRAVELLVTVVALRYGAGLLVGVFAVRGLVQFRRPWLPSREERRAFGAYAGRMQLSSMTSFFNGEVDALVVAALLPVRYVGIFAAAHQVASAARSLPLFAFPPLLTTLSNSFARGGHHEAVAEFDRIESRWLPLVLGYTLIGACVALFAVPIWLGDDFALAGLLAAVLILGYGVQVALTGVRTCFVRSIGRPGLETRYSVVSTIVNVVATVPLTLAIGALGVVSATALALIGASIYFVRLCRPLGLVDRRPPGMWWPAMAAAVGGTLLGEQAIRQLGWHGPLAVAAAGAVGLAGLAILLVPMRSHLRSRLAPSGLEES
jgi:O-antigen/teichoic acid export membrane protein